MPEQRPSRSAKAKANAKLTRRTTRGSARDETNDDASEHENVEFDTRKMHDGMRRAFQKMADDYQSAVIDPASAIHKDQLTALNRQMKKSLHPAVPKAHIVPDGWSREDENDVLDQWEAEKDLWINIHDPDRYLNLWKICLQFAKCTPWDIVGFNTKLSFELSGRAGSGEEDENHTWSAPFIDRLAWLIPHPAWAGAESSSRPALLATAIQYAVILRTNDQRVWRLSHLGDEFLKTFAALCRDNCPCSIAGIHAKVLARRREEGIKTIPIISRVFQSLEKVIQTPTDSFVPADEELYFVTTQDFTNLIKALDQIVDPDTNIRMFLPVEFAYESAKSARGGRQPPTREQLHEYHKLALIEEMRRKAKATRLTRSIRDSDGGHDDDAFAPESLTVPERPTSTTSTTRRRRWSHVSATPSDEESPLAASSEAHGLESEPRLTRTRPRSASITQFPGLGSGRDLLLDSDDSSQSGGDAPGPGERDDDSVHGFSDNRSGSDLDDGSDGFGDDFGHGSGSDLDDDVDNGSGHDGEDALRPVLSDESGDLGSGPDHDGEDAPGPDLGGDAGSGPGQDGEGAPEPVDDDAMSVDSVDADHGLCGTREEPASPRAGTQKLVRWGRRTQAYDVRWLERF